MFKLNKERVVYLDCDDSAILWSPENYPHEESELVYHEDQYGKWAFLPHKKNVEFVKNLKRQGYGVVVWSAAGADWAEKVVKMLKLEGYVDVILSKPELAVDDLLDAKRIIKSIVWIDPVTGEYKRNQ